MGRGGKGGLKGPRSLAERGKKKGEDRINTVEEKLTFSRLKGSYGPDSESKKHQVEKDCEARP